MGSRGAGPGAGAQYFDRSPRSASAPRTIAVRLPDVGFELTTDRGVFSGDRLDRGTDTLLRRGERAVPAGDVLDLGAGYGPIALTLARRNPAATVWAVEVNERARELCAANASALRLANVRTLAPDAVPDDLRFAAIWSNPPIRVGKAVLHELLQRWLARLAPGAVAHLVVHKHLGSDSLARWLAGEGWAVARRASHDGYRLLDVRHPPTDARG